MEKVISTNVHKEHIENVINNTFAIIKRVYENQKEGDDRSNTRPSGSRIIFPKKRQDEQTRVSEQELRFIFVEQLNKEILEKEWDVYYSVETPTKDSYIFKDNPRRNGDGQSANFDLVIHDSNFKRIALIEFKAKNPDKDDYQKDFVKLSNEEEEGQLRYFLQIVVNADNGTTDNIENKKISNKESIPRWGNKSVRFICHSLSSKEAIIDEVLNNKQI